MYGQSLTARMFASSSGFKFCPISRAASPNSVALMLPEPSRSKKSNTSLISAICSRVTKLSRGMAGWALLLALLLAAIARNDA